MDGWKMILSSWGKLAVRFGEYSLQLSHSKVIKCQGTSPVPKLVPVGHLRFSHRQFFRWENGLRCQKRLDHPKYLFIETMFSSIFFQPKTCNCQSSLCSKWKFKFPWKSVPTWSDGGIGMAYLKVARNASAFKGTNLFVKRPMTSQLKLVCTWSTNENMHQNKNTEGWDETLTVNISFEILYTGTFWNIRLGRSTFLKRIPMCLGFSMWHPHGTAPLFLIAFQPKRTKRFADTHRSNSFDRSGWMSCPKSTKLWNARFKYMHACNLHSNVLLLFTHWIILGDGCHCAPRCLNIRLQQDIWCETTLTKRNRTPRFQLCTPQKSMWITRWPSQTDATIANRHAQTQSQNAASPQEWLKIRMPCHASFLAMCVCLSRDSSDIFGLLALPFLRENEVAKRDGFNSHVVVIRVFWHSNAEGCFATQVDTRTRITIFTPSTNYIRKKISKRYRL